MWSSDPLQRHARPQLTLQPSGSGGDGRADADATTNELRDVAEELRRVERKLAAIEVLEMTEWTAIKAATTHVRLLCRPSGYAFTEADEPPPLIGDSLEADGEAFVVERFRPSPFPDDCRRCAVLVAART
jgi:hypothetical protein